MAARQWTDEQRAKQSAMIRQWQPWKHSTGARTPEGKAVSSQNVVVGQRKRQQAIEQATQELEAALAKLRKLSNGRVNLL
jgi:hypothetical protein